MPNKPEQYKLIETTEFTVDDKGIVYVYCKRESYTVSFQVNKTIQEFMQAFSTYKSIEEVADELSKKGFKHQQVVEFATKVFKTPLSQCFKQGLRFTHPKNVCASFGLSLKKIFRNTKFQTVLLAQCEQGQEKVIRLVKVQKHEKEFTPQYKRANFEYDLLSRFSDVDTIINVEKLENDKFIALAYPFYNGLSLKKYVFEPLRLFNRVLLAKEIISTIFLMHHNHVVHGDIHPSNVLVSKQGKPMLIDFDCAYQIGGEKAGKVGGVPHFLPPENASENWLSEESPVPISNLGELYQIGLITYYCLTAKLVFDKTSLTDLIQDIKTAQGQWYNITPEGEKIDSQLIAALKQCTHIEPERRVEGASKLLSVLENMLTLHSGIESERLEIL